MIVQSGRASRRWRVPLRGIVAVGFLLGACGARPIVATFDSIPTPVLLSRVDRVGGDPSQMPPPPVTEFRARVASTKYIEVESTTTTETKTGYAAGSGGKSGYPSSSGGGAKAYKAPPRATATTTRTDVDVFAAIGYQGSNLLTYQALRAMASRDAKEAMARQGKTLPSPRDANIYIDKLRAGSFFFVDSESDTDEEGNSKSKTTYTTVNFLRVRGLIAPAP